MSGPKSVRTWLATVCAVVMMTALTGPAQAAKPFDPTITLLAAGSWKVCSWTYFDVGAPDYMGATPDEEHGDISLGIFGAGGKVVGGEAALAIALDIGTAPVSQIDLPNVIDDRTGLPGLRVTPAQPTATGVVNVGSGATWYTNLPSLNGTLVPLAEGSGTAVVRLALLTRQGQSWKTAPGMTLPKNITIATECLGMTHSNRGFTIGGGYSRSK